VIWLQGINSFGNLPLRATADGQALLFESRADLTGFESKGKTQIYRFGAAAGSLECLSCDPTQKAPDTDASLLSPRNLLDPLKPASIESIVPNLSLDGKRAFFESTERLVPADEDGLRDVYEWEAEGKGSCAEPGGCLFLISSGQSARDDYLYGVSESGDDVFIRSADLLSAEDTEEAPSIYDARVGGGFAPPPPPPAECQGEACQPAAVATSDPTPASSTYAGKGNVIPDKEARPRCPKGKRKVRRAGKPRCVPRQPKPAKRANAKGRAGR
jgi:hypothetical protein